MKKLFLLVALMFGLASCQNELEGLNVSVGEEQEVMLNVSLPESTRSASSTGFDFTDFESNSKYDLRFILEISYNGKVVREVKTTETTSATFPVRLAPEKPYTFTVWADLVDEDSNADLFYNTADGLSNIKINLDKWTPNVEARDAYYLSMKKTFNAAADLSMELKRPFAKVRVVATDIKKVTDFDLNPTSAVATYSKQMFTSFNALTGEKAGLANVEHSFKYAEVDKYTDKAGERTVFADYIFVPEDGTVQFTLNIYADEAKNNLINDNAFNTPILVEQNKVTSIVGDILTEGGNVKVTVDSTLGEKETINYVNSANSLQETINKIEDGKSGNVKLGGNIDLGNIISIGTLSTRAAEPTYGLLIPAGKSVVIDLNGFTISQSKECKASYSMIQNNGNLTIIDSSEAKSGKISFKDTSAGDPSFGWGSYTISNYGGTIVVENGTIEHLGEQDAHMICAIWQYSGSTTINGGVISTPNYRSARLWGGDMTINGGEFKGQLWLQAVDNTSNLTINGGTFAPRGNDSSSVFVTNSSYEVAFAVTGGHFTTKIGASKPFGCITGGTFTTAAKEGTSLALVNDDYTWVEAEGLWTLKRKATIAKIGDDEYTSLIKAIAAVQDGDTITLVANETFTENNRSHNSGTWYDGLYYVGDKSFTIDLGGKKISQDGAVNDYLLNFKNTGSKANTITIKNGIVDAGTAAYCALCTSSVQENQLTINLENVTLYNNISNGSTAKIRGGAILNVKSGTKIIGENSYLGIECVGATVNIYDGAELYMNGKTSYNGCLAGVGYGGTINVFGGYGKGVKGGFIAMTSGGTINISGGEWIANTDGTVGSNSNWYVLTAQSNKYESGFVGGAYINVTGGTFRGGMDAWVLNNIEGEEAKISICGGNYNVNPTRFLVEGYEANNIDGIWSVRVAPVAKIGNVEYETLEAAVAAAKAGDTITLLKDVKPAYLPLLKDITLDGNGQLIDATIDGDNLTIAGHIKVTLFNGSNYNRSLTILEGGCLEVTGTGRVSLGFGNTWNVTGSIEDAKTADKANIKPSLIIPGGVSITGGYNATLNVTNAYVKFGNTSSKNSSANGEFTLNFNNSIVDFTNQFTFAEPTSGKTPTFNLNIKDSVLTTATKLCMAASGCNTVIDNSNVTIGTYIRNSGNVEIKNGSVVTGSTIQFGENGGNNGAIRVDASSLTINASAAGHALDGKGEGSITATNGAEVLVTYYKDMTISVDETSSFTGTEVE